MEPIERKYNINFSDFFNELMSHILDGLNIPKVQVERAINPIISLFIESIVEEYFQTNPKFSGKYKLVSPEFPLKKENNQSTNIDYLLVNNIKNILVFFELKSDVGSIDFEQLQRYTYFKNKINNDSAIILKENLVKIKKASSKAYKYKYILTNFEKEITNPNNLRNVIILYLVPDAKKASLLKNNTIDFVLNYSDLPNLTNHRYSDYWTIIRSNLLKLDTYFNNY
jgi:hypothetical protein